MNITNYHRCHNAIRSTLSILNVPEVLGKYTLHSKQLKYEDDNICIIGSKNGCLHSLLKINSGMVYRAFSYDCVIEFLFGSDEVFLTIKGKQQIMNFNDFDKEILFNLNLSYDIPVSIEQVLKLKETFIKIESIDIGLTFK
ncbi:hypothetical protein XaC1_207 [Xanthomonas phage XaC1]|nr:hypothetical protein XaC1_207 [Xanthomonas phage XaC1]